MKPNKTEVAERLKKIREELGVSISEMGEMIGTSKANLSSYLRALALPPTEIVENITKIVDVSKMWILYGEPEEHIKSFILWMGYEKLLEDYPSIPNKIYEQYLDMKFDEYYNSPYIEKVWLMKSLFRDVYKPLFEKYVTGLLEELFSKIDEPIYSVNKEINYKKFISRILYLLDNQNPSIKYGETEKILEIAGEELEDRIGIYRNNDLETGDIISNIISSLECDEEIISFISDIADRYNRGFNPETDLGKEIINIANSIRISFIELESKISIEEQGKTFYKKQ